MKIILSHFLYIIWAYRMKYFLKAGYWRYAFVKLRTDLLKKIGFKKLSRLFLCPSHDCNANCLHCYENSLTRSDIH